MKRPADTLVNFKTLWNRTQQYNIIRVPIKIIIRNLDPAYCGRASTAFRLICAVKQENKHPSIYRYDTWCINKHNKRSTCSTELSTENFSLKLHLKVIIYFAHTLLGIYSCYNNIRYNLYQHARFTRNGIKPA